MLSHCISLIYNFLGAGKKIEHAKYSDLSKSEGKKLQKSNCMAVTLFVMSAKNCSLPPMQLEVTWKYKSVGRKPGCCFRLQKRATETPSLEVPGNQPQALGFTLCLREKPCSHSIFWFLVNLGRDRIRVHLLVPNPCISLGLIPEMNASPAPVPMQLWSGFSTTPSKKKRRNFWRMTQRHQCASKKEAALTCHQLELVSHDRTFATRIQLLPYTI